MSGDIRNLKSLQVFMVAYELGNVTRAARELHISQSAVSYHIKRLETDLGVILFRRKPHGLEPTKRGKQLAHHVDRGLSAIRAGLDSVASRPGSVRVAMLPMFASRWLSSRLGHLLEANPDLQLSIQNHNNSFAKLAAPETFADLGIQWGRGDWEGFHITRLWPERLALVCSPGYLAEHPITAPEDLLTCSLLHVDDTRMWDEWMAGNGLQMAPSARQMMLEDRHFQLSSTINGLGVSLFAAWLIERELQSGELVAPFGETFATSFAYHLIVPRNVDPTPELQRFIDWMENTSGAFAAARPVR